MALTNERAEMLANYFNENKEERLGLFDVEAANAVEQMNADGCDVTLEEFQEFAEEVEAAAANGADSELDENSLDNVSGGVAAIPVIIGVGIALWAYRKYKNR
jgi:hypothetical protein